jgi:arylsulfatase A-like enzyme
MLGKAPIIGSVVDVPATLLYLYGVPIPEDYDGAVLTELFEPDYVEQHPIEHQAGDQDRRSIIQHYYSEEEERQFFDHLKALGYLE